MSKKQLAFFSTKCQLYMHKSFDHEQGVPGGIKKLPLKSLTGIFCRSVYIVQQFNLMQTHLTAIALSVPANVFLVDYNYYIQAVNYIYGDEMTREY